MEIKNAVDIISEHFSNLWGCVGQKAAWSIIRAKLVEEKLTSASSTNKQSKPCSACGVELGDNFDAPA